MIPGSRLGPYEVVARIGAGGMGEVWRARDERLGRDVAIKVLPAELARDPERVRRFEKEARATGALNHPNILSIHDVGFHEGSPYLVEELLEGQTLREVLRSGALPARRAVEVAVQVAHGLAAAHGKGIVHRDLKPENLFVTAEGHVKILDFGLAKLTEATLAPEVEREASTLVKSTELGVVLGTVGYMAPEQVRGLPCDHRADIFSLGCVLYEMLLGQRAFKGPTPADTMSAILSKEPEALVRPGWDIPPALQGIVNQCLEKRPEDRFSSAHDLALALHASSGMGAVTAAMPLATPRSRRLLLGAALLVPAGIVVAVAIWQPWHAVSPPPGSSPERISSILALPCKVYGAPEVAFLTDAVPGTISTLLSGVDGIDTKVPPTSFEVEKVKGDLGQLAELYQVSSFIVTSINTSAGGFALNVQLVDAATRKVRWGKQYEGPREAYNDLARQAAEGIRMAVRPAAAPVPTAAVSSEAELALREGIYHSNRYNNLQSPDEFDAALAAFTRALTLDPTLAVAAGKVAALYVYRFEVEGDVSKPLKHAGSWARQALGLDPRCGEAWAALSMAELHATQTDPERGIDYAVKAVAFAPRDASAHQTLGIGASLGSVSLFVAAELRSFELDHFLLVSAGNAAAGLCWLGRPAEALEVVDRALRVEPDWPFGLTARGFALLKLGRLEEAEGQLRRCEDAATATYLFGELWRQIALAFAVAQRDDANSQALATRVLASALDAKADANLVSNAGFFAAPALAQMGRTDDALRILERSVEVGVPPAYDWLLLEPDFEPLRGDPRFARVLAASRDGAAMVARILGEARTRGELPAYLDQPLEELERLLGAPPD